MKKISQIFYANDFSLTSFSSQALNSAPKLPQATQDSIASQIYIPNADEIGIRADVFIAQKLQISRSKAEKLFAKGQVLLNGAIPTKQGIPLKAQDEIALLNPPQTLNTSLNSDSAPLGFSNPKQSYHTKPEGFKIPILYQDEDLLILNKPAGLVVHRTNEQDEQFTLVQWLQNQNFPLSNLGDSYRAGIVHRLDRGTSGAIVIAKNNFAHENLKQQLQTRQMGRYYLCVIDQALKESLIINSPLVRHSKNRLKYITTNSQNPNAKPAKTAFFKIATTRNIQSNCELIGAKLFSGRTHQIRVHLSSINRHILGDSFYGYQDCKCKNLLTQNLQDRILLHSHLLYLQHPKSGEILHIYAPIFQEMQDFLNLNFDLKSFCDSLGNLIFPLDKLYQSAFVPND
ncbi:RluA family pseudouridine synthase [Helicobacter sp. MIT 05-5294]|uniref:RluA family pseudouridine synthase n=1 Tax=Helicobacter sp. MIT 05-5294 TaxID=1548150 RepID=UPI000AE3831C|nr:RluA family pseudouridine synthase [Helicobacter sp. MIT 05-5294]